MTQAKVLVIDDDPIVLEAARERLEGAGYEVVVRNEAVGTSRTVLDEDPDIVLLDVMMPAISGERIATLLKSSRLTSGVGVILYSSKSEAELKALIESSGALGAISKSASDEAFLTQFQSLLQRYRMKSLEEASGQTG